MAGARRSTRTPEQPRVVTRPAGETLWRVSGDPIGLAFSTRADRQNRFSPVLTPDGQAVAGAWYGATSPAGAIFESVFHDIRPSDADPRVQPNQYLRRYLSPVVTTRDLLMVDLTTLGLQAIGITRTALIESRPTRYAFTLGVAERLRRAAPEADGFAWVSRAHDSSQSLVVYADPGRPRMLDRDPSELALALGLGRGLALLRELATEARITVVLPSPERTEGPGR